MGHFTIRQEFFLYSYTLEVEEQEKVDKYLKFLEDSQVAKILQKEESPQPSARKRSKRAADKKIKTKNQEAKSEQKQKYKKAVKASVI